MRKRVLNLDLKAAVEAFQGIKWKFFNADEDAKAVSIEVPRGSDEAYVVELCCKDDAELKRAVDALLEADFFMQTKRFTAEW